MTLPIMIMHWQWLQKRTRLGSIGRPAIHRGHG